MLSVECPGAVVQLKNSGTLLCCDVPWYTVRCTYREYLNEGAELAHEGRQVPPLDQGCTELTAREHSEHHYIKYTHVPICIRKRTDTHYNILTSGRSCMDLRDLKFSRKLGVSVLFLSPETVFINSCVGYTPRSKNC